MNVTKEKVHWRDEIKDAVKTQQALEEFLNKKIPKTKFPLFLPRSFLMLIKKAGENSPLWKQFIPDKREDSPWGVKDPIGDHLRTPIGHIVHRYSSRVLLMPSPLCPIACRYCFRKHLLNYDDKLFSQGLKVAFSYIRQNRNISEIILSGGDPLILEDQKLKFILDHLSEIPSVKDIRIHTRTPIILPNRITSKFLTLIHFYKERFRFFHIVIHANHATEINDNVKTALKNILKAGISLLSQSVLLKGVNDSDADLINLIEAFLDCGVRPYYLHHPDKVQGGEHFFLNLEEGEKIYSALKAKVSGWAIPKYVVDSPKAVGKINVEKALLNSKDH